MNQIIYTDIIMSEKYLNTLIDTIDNIIIAKNFNYSTIIDEEMKKNSENDPTIEYGQYKPLYILNNLTNKYDVFLYYFNLYFYVKMKLFLFSEHSGSTFNAPRNVENLFKYTKYILSLLNVYYNNDDPKYIQGILKSFSINNPLIKYIFVFDYVIFFLMKIDKKINEIDNFLKKEIVDSFEIEKDKLEKYNVQVEYIKNNYKNEYYINNQVVFLKENGSDKRKVKNLVLYRTFYKRYIHSGYKMNNSNENDNKHSSDSDDDSSDDDSSDDESNFTNFDMNLIVNNLTTSTENSDNIQINNEILIINNDEFLYDTKEHMHKTYHYDSKIVEKHVEKYYTLPKHDNIIYNYNIDSTKQNKIDDIVKYDISIILFSVDAIENDESHALIFIFEKHKDLYIYGPNGMWDYIFFSKGIKQIIKDYYNYENINIYNVLVKYDEFINNNINIDKFKERKKYDFISTYLSNSEHIVGSKEDFMTYMISAFTTCYIWALLFGEIYFKLKYYSYNTTNEEIMKLNPYSMNRYIIIKYNTPEKMHNLIENYMNYLFLEKIERKDEKTHMDTYVNDVLAYSKKRYSTNSPTGDELYKLVLNDYVYSGRELNKRKKIHVSSTRSKKVKYR